MTYYFNKAAEVSATYVYRWAIICKFWHFMHFWDFFFFLRIINKCDNTDTENIKLIVLTFYFMQLDNAKSTFFISNTCDTPTPLNLISQNHQFLWGNWLCIIDCSDKFYILMKSDLKSEFSYMQGGGDH